jgi:E3 ubiquitin-protein ligase BOI and related proteins
VLVYVCDIRAAEELHDMTNSAMFLGEPGGGHLLAAAAQQQQVPTVGGSTAFSDLTCRNNYSGCFVTRRVGDGLIMEGHGGDLLPQAFALAGEGPTSGRAMPTTAAAPVSHGLLSHLYRHSVEADALIRIEVSEFGWSDHQPVMLLCSGLVVKNGV